LLSETKLASWLIEIDVGEPDVVKLTTNGSAVTAPEKELADRLVTEENVVEHREVRNDR
jgi:hypothetical protein